MEHYWFSVADITSRISDFKNIYNWKGRTIFYFLNSWVSRHPQSFDNFKKYYTIKKSAKIENSLEDVESCSLLNHSWTTYSPQFYDSYELGP